MLDYLTFDNVYVIGTIFVVLMGMTSIIQGTIATITNNKELEREANSKLFPCMTLIALLIFMKFCMG